MRGTTNLMHMSRRNLLPSLLLLVSVGLVAGALGYWKYRAISNEARASENQPEMAEAVSQAVAERREYRDSATSIGTVLAVRSITLRNELPGTVREVNLQPGAIVEPGQVLVALDVSVEEAELAALEAAAALAEANLRRKQQLSERGAEPMAELERAIAERDVARAQIDRAKATIARKTIRAHFRARVGLSDVHVGQFLEAGSLLTTLQGVDEAVHVDFDVSQQVAAGLRPGDAVEVSLDRDHVRALAKVVALDARVDASTRNAKVRARIEENGAAFTPGSSVRVRVAYGKASQAVAIPASALRRGPAGDHVYVIENDAKGEARVHARKVYSGPSLGDAVLVMSGLREGEKLAASGSFKLRDGLKVVVLDNKSVAANTNR
jgi:membrane fusion protein, multidrug efflux system